jgi:peptidoglycan hydrolase-like protein with peptidoglycan-binding domain
MSNLFKSKFVLGLMLVAAVVFSTGTAEAAITKTLKYGMKDAQVKELQQNLNAAGFTVSTSGAGSVGYETTSFGTKTKLAVQAYQTSKGLVADGVFGPASRAAWTGGTTTGGNTTLPAGCTTTSGFSPITGQACNGTTTNTQTGPVTATLASTNPASGTLVAGQATANLAQFTFNGTGTVTAVTLQRIGVSADTTPSNVYLFDGAVRLTDAASVSSNGTVTFTAPAGLFTVSGSKTITVKSDIASGTSGQTVGFTLATFTTSAGTTTANLSGNIHSIATASLASVTSGTETPSASTLNPGPNVTVWQSTLTVSTRDVWMKRLAFRNIGSAPASAFANFKLYVNGVQVGSATGLDANGYVTFDMNSSPVNLASGSRVVRVDADIVSGASRTVQFSLRNAADVNSER